MDKDHVSKSKSQQRNWGHWRLRTAGCASWRRRKTVLHTWWPKQRVCNPTTADDSGF